MELSPISSSTTLVASSPATADVATRSAPFARTENFDLICSFALSPLSNSATISLMIWLTIFRRVSSGLESKECSQAFTHICKNFPLLFSCSGLLPSKLFSIKFNNDVLPLPHSPWIPIVIGVSQRSIKLVKASAWGFIFNESESKFAFG